jgi:hypothetical protein
MSTKDFDWTKFQKNNKYSDEELEVFKADPRRANAAPKLFSPEVAKKCLIFEVVESHGCTARMKVGDRLFFNALGVLDLRRSCPTWCAHALTGIVSIANMVQDRYVAGLDPNDMVYNHIPCMDVGAKYGWGRVIMRAYVVDESDLEK